MESNLEKLKVIAKKKTGNENTNIRTIVINTSIPTKSGVDITEKVEKLYRNLLIRV